MKWIKYLMSFVLVFNLSLLIVSCGGDNEYETITIPPFDIDDSKLTTVQINLEKIDLEDEINEDYSINFDWPKTEFVDAVNIKIPYNADISDNIFGLYYNHDSKKYEPVDYSVDTN